MSNQWNDINQGRLKKSWVSIIYSFIGNNRYPCHRLLLIDCKKLSIVLIVSVIAWNIWLSSWVKYDTTHSGAAPTHAPHFRGISSSPANCWKILLIQISTVFTLFFILAVSWSYECPARKAHLAQRSGLDISHAWDSVQSDSKYFLACKIRYNSSWKTKKMHFITIFKSSS